MGLKATKKFKRKEQRKGAGAKKPKVRKTVAVKKQKEVLKTVYEAKSASKKNVSFAEELEESKIIEEFDQDERPVRKSTEPKRGILRTRASKPSSPTKNAPSASKPLQRGARPKLLVKKSVKEQLLQMDKKERRKFIRELREKRKPQFKNAQQAKFLWEKLRRFVILKMLAY
jgi:hypothetical protein